MALKLNVVICSTRPGRIGPSVATWFQEFAASNSGSPAGDHFEDDANG